MVEILKTLVEFHGFNQFILIVCAYYMLKGVFYLIPKHIIRHLNIRKAGWPPKYLDADGDYKKEDKTA